MDNNFKILVYVLFFLPVQGTLQAPVLKCGACQPRSQGLSSLRPLVGRKTLVHPESGWQKICWVEGVAEYFVWLM